MNKPLPTVVMLIFNNVLFCKTLQTLLTKNYF